MNGSEKGGGHTRPVWGAGVVKRSTPCKKDAKQLVSTYNKK